MALPPYRCEGCGLAWTPSRADGARNGQRCPRCGGVLVRDDAVTNERPRIYNLGPVDTMLTAWAAFHARVAALEELARTVADNPPMVEQSNGPSVVCAYCDARDDTVFIEPRHTPECPVTRAKVLLGMESP